jgi:hypothetical protein
MPGAKPKKPMQPAFKRFLITSLILAAILTSVMFCVFEFALNKTVTVGYYMIVVYFLTLNGLVHFMLLKAGEKDPKQFVPKFMGAMGLKMFMSLIYIFAYVVLNQEEVLYFAVTFLVLYFSFTALEIVSILKALKQYS